MNAPQTFTPAPEQVKPDVCPGCGALPCDWTNVPAGADHTRRETLNEVTDALYRIMPNSDSYETKAFVAELLEEVLSRNPFAEQVSA